MKRKCQQCGKSVKMVKAVINVKNNGKWEPSHIVDVCPICDTEQVKKLNEANCRKS